MSTTITPSFTLEELLSQHAWAQRLARRLVGPSDADDLVQDGWVASLEFPGPNDWKKLFTPAWAKRARGPMSVGGWRAHFTILPEPPAH